MPYTTVYERFLWFNHQVLAGKYPGAGSLAAEFGISRKTAQRNVDFMRDRLKCPLVYDTSRKGYYYSDKTFSLPYVYISPDELVSLLIAKKLFQDISGGQIRKDIESVVEKITSILHKHAGYFTSFDDVLSFETFAYTASADNIFRTVIEATAGKRTISFSYYSPLSDETMERRVDPYHLFHYAGTWHLIAFCHKRKAVRDFVLSRITNLRVLDQTFNMQKGFQIEEYLHSTFGTYKGKEKAEVTLRFNPLESRWIRNQIWHKKQKVKVLKDGSIELTFPVSGYYEIMMEVLKRGSAVKVIKPKKLRDMVKAEARRILRQY